MHRHRDVQIKVNECMFRKSRQRKARLDSHRDEQLMASQHAFEGGGPQRKTHFDRHRDAQIQRSSKISQDQICYHSNFLKAPARTKAKIQAIIQHDIT